MPDLIRKLRRLREFNGYSQEAVAFHLHISQSSYSDLENGKARMSIERLSQIAVFYGLSPSDILSKTLMELLQCQLDLQTRRENSETNRL